MTTALVYDTLFLEHIPPSHHPESPDRLRAIMDFLEQQGVLQHPDLLQLKPRPATDDELAAVHTREHIANIIAKSGQAMAEKPVALDPDTYVSPKSAEVARLAAGATLTAVDAVMDHRAANAFALVRPPGHHAESDQAMGFCLFNNAAIAARYAQNHFNIDKILIVDYDVHHGNGTQEIFYNDPTVAYFSTHQAPFYPGTGAYDEIGNGNAAYTICNAPVPAQSIFELYDAIFREILFPFTDRFKPDLIILSAGFDAHWLDPLADEYLDVAGYAMLTRYVQELAEKYCDGKLVAVLEGGYDTQALAECVGAALSIFMKQETIVDTLGEAPSPAYRWNSVAVTDQLRAVQNLTGYRRKPRVPGPAPDSW